MGRYCRRLPGFDAKEIQLFAQGLSTRQIQHTVQDLYGVSVSPELIAKVTDAVLDEYEAWQSRPLQERRNREAVRVDRRFTTADTRIKLKPLYPSIQR